MNARPLFKLMSLMLLVIVFSFSFMMPRQAHAEVDVSFSVFYDALAPYGNWVNHRTYGQVWYPRDVPHGWRPYTDGHWAHTDEYGWLWVADQSWGWAPFHYGRWAWDDWYGWLWVPGYTWSPAWVFWRSGGGYAAWAPMPPNVLWQSGGLNISYFNYDRDLHRDSWVAVREYDLPYHHVRERCFSPRENPRIIQVTNYINNVTVINKTIVNQGVPVRHIEHVTGRPVRKVMPVVRQEMQGHHQDHRRPLTDDALEIIRPNRIEMSAIQHTHRDEELARRLDGKISETSKIMLPIAPNSVQSGNKAPRMPKRLAIAPVLEPSPKPVLPAPGLTEPLNTPSTVMPERSLLPDLDAEKSKQPAIGRNQKVNKPAQPLKAQVQGHRIEQTQQERDTLPVPVPLPLEPQQAVPRSVQPSQLANELQPLEATPAHPQEPIVDQQPSEKNLKQIKKQQAEQARQEARQMQQQQAEQARQEARQMQQQQAEQARQEARQMQQQQAEQARQEARQMQQQQAEQARQEARQMQQQQAEQARQAVRQMQQQQVEQARQEARQMQQQQAEQARQEARQMQQQQAEQVRQAVRQMQQQQVEQARQQTRQMPQQQREVQEHPARNGRTKKD